jgi:hypothetical protein
MKKYKKDSSCPKCGELGATSETYYSFGGNEYRIKRRCGNCKYNWEELPLDIEDQENE